MMHYTTIIAEAGECFNGDMDTAHEMIRIAKDSGCDIVKFQLLDMTEVAPDDPEYEWFTKIELDKGKIMQLIGWANESEIDILFTPVSVRTASWLVELGQRKVKIASSFVKKMELLSFVNENFDLVFVSTGMSSLDEVCNIVAKFDKPREIQLLHCISEYPTGPILETRGLAALDEKDTHLEMMVMLRDLYPNLNVGYSDHTDGIFVPITAAAMGADIIEKHFTLDKKTPVEHYNKGLEYMGTDHVVSVEPLELKEMVKQIRRVDEVRGNRIWRRSAGEQVLMDFLQGRYKKR